MPAGRGRCWPGRWPTLTFSMSGASCASTRLILALASPGARATIPPSRRKLPMWLGSISTRPPRRLCCVSTRSLRSRPFTAVEQLQEHIDAFIAAYKKHPNVHFHFIPTRSSWLNQVETWFSILQGQSLNGASNETAEPFAWTKKKVHQRRFKNRRITQL